MIVVYTINAKYITVCVKTNIKQLALKKDFRKFDCANF